MKRSEINQLILDGLCFFDEMNFKLPPFAHWSIDEWTRKNHEYDEIREYKLGWDVTDFGSGDFNRQGLFLFTLRNGNPNLVNSKTYAEKIMIVKENQVTPYHFHWKKREDIINRGGGNLMIKLYNSTKDGEFSKHPVQIHVDGRTYEVPAGTVIRLTPGESITLMTGQYHSFWGEPGSGMVLVGEVSECNDDAMDNRFYEDIGRFPEIEEDEPALFYLCNEYPFV